MAQYFSNIARALLLLGLFLCSHLSMAWSAAGGSHPVSRWVNVLQYPLQRLSAELDAGKRYGLNGSDLELVHDLSKLDITDSKNWDAFLPMINAIEAFHQTPETFDILMRSDPDVSRTLIVEGIATIAHLRERAEQLERKARQTAMALVNPKDPQ